MPVVARLMRMGTKHRPIYRISVADSRRRTTGKFIEHIGTYDPHLDKMGNKMLRLNVARAKYWIAMGMQPSTVVARLLARFHLIPTPPQRQLPLVDPLVFKALAGEDIRSELEAQSQARVTVQSPGEVLVHPPSLANRRQKELTPERVEQLKKQAPWKLQSFPFDYNPTSATMAAWNQARLFHGHMPIDDAAENIPIDWSAFDDTVKEDIEEMEEMDEEEDEDEDQLFDQAAEDSTRGYEFDTSKGDDAEFAIEGDDPNSPTLAELEADVEDEAAADNSSSASSTSTSSKKQ